MRWTHRVFDPGCRRCERLVAHLGAMTERHPAYHNAPVPPFGVAEPRLVIVGLGPGAHGANATGRPFTGDFAGVLLYRCLYELGLASAAEAVSARDGLKLNGCRITNAVKCLPPGNRPATSEVDACNRYLAAELESLSADGVVVALGRVAHRAVLRAFGLKQSTHAFAHAAEHALPEGRRLVDSYHCSRYNTQTGRLTEAMFSAVLARAKSLAGL